MKPAKKFTAAVAALAVSSSIFTGVANAAPDPATGVELNVPLNRTVTLDVISNQGADVQQALYDIRGEMWDKNVPFEGTTLREAASKAGYNNKDAYVNAAKVDSNMSFIAAQRAAETLVWPNLAHKRPTNDSCEISDCATVSSLGERTFRPVRTCATRSCSYGAEEKSRLCGQPRGIQTIETATFG